MDTTILLIGTLCALGLVGIEVICQDRFKCGKMFLTVTRVVIFTAPLLYLSDKLRTVNMAFLQYTVPFIAIKYAAGVALRSKNSLHAIRPGSLCSLVIRKTVVPIKRISSDKGVIAVQLRHLFILCVISMILAGCAPPSTLNLEKVPAIKRVGVITRLTDHDLKVFDHTGVGNKSYLKYIGGAAPLLLERYFPIDRPIVWAEAQYAINRSLKGNPEEIKRYIASDVIKSMVDAKITEKLFKKYAPINLTKVNNRQSADSYDAKYLLTECKESGIDTLVVINFAYGLAAYKEKQSSVTIDGDMTVYEVNTGDILLKDTVESEQDFREHRSLEEFTAENGKLFNDDLNSAINSFGYLVARKLEVW